MKLRDVNEKINNGTERLQGVNVDIGILKTRLEGLNNDAESLKDNATALQEANVEGWSPFKNLKKFYRLYFSFQNFFLNKKSSLFQSKKSSQKVKSFPVKNFSSKKSSLFKSRKSSQKSQVFSSQESLLKNIKSFPVKNFFSKKSSQKSQWHVWQNSTGALNLTRDAARRSQDAQNRVLQSKASLTSSENIRRRVEEMLAKAEIEANEGQTVNEDLLKELDAKVVELNAKIPGLNSMVHF